MGWRKEKVRVTTEVGVAYRGNGFCPTCAAKQKEKISGRKKEAGKRWKNQVKKEVMKEATLEVKR